MCSRFTADEKRQTRITVNNDKVFFFFLIRGVLSLQWLSGEGNKSLPMSLFLANVFYGEVKNGFDCVDDSHVCVQDFEP